MEYIDRVDVNHRESPGLDGYHRIVIRRQAGAFGMIYSDTCLRVRTHRQAVTALQKTQEQPALLSFFFSLCSVRPRLTSQFARPCRIGRGQGCGESFILQNNPTLL